ncbi:uncharacterized protein TNCV_4924421 [Trichonephila clavipes]|nr:uncharacterized protein TNCV_4924421 [Trichonephila clavipes]
MKAKRNLGDGFGKEAVTARTCQRWLVKFRLGNFSFKDEPRSERPSDVRGCGSPVVKVSNHGRLVMSSIPVPLKTRRVGQRYTLNLSRAETSSRWSGVVVRRGGASSGVVHVT